MESGTTCSHQRLWNNAADKDITAMISSNYWLNSSVRMAANDREAWHNDTHEDEDDHNKGHGHSVGQLITRASL